MNLRRSSRDDRGVSVVVGTVLLIGMVTMAMAVLGAAVLSTDLVDSPPRAEFVYQEDSSGTVAIGLTDVQRLTAGGTEIKLEGEGSCGTWDGSGDLEEGEITVVDGSDCPDSLKQGDVLQVIGDRTLLDTYELRGVSPAFDQCEGAIDSGYLEVNPGDEIECDLVAEDGGRVDVDLDMNGGELEGTVNLSSAGELDLAGGTLDGDANSEELRLETDWTVTGDLTVPATASESSVNLKGRTEVGGSLLSDGKSIELSPDVDVGEDVVITGSDETLTVKRDATIGGEADLGDNDAFLNTRATIDGPVTVGELDLGQDTRVNDDVTADDTVSLDSGAVIDGSVTAGNVRFDGDGTIAGDVDSGDVTLEPDGTIQGDVEGDEMLFKDRVRIGGDVDASGDVTLKDGGTIEGDLTATEATCEGSATVEGTVNADTNNGC